MRDRGCLSQAGTLYPVDGSIFIGSAHDCEVRVKDAAPRQCQIVRTAEGFLLHDLTGQKVTKVNGARIERHLLRDGEVVVIGSTEFRWTVTPEPEEVVVAAPTPVRRRTPTSPIPIVKQPHREQNKRFVLFLGLGAGLVISIVLVVVFSSSSNADRSISRRDRRPARSESTTPSSGAGRETAPVEPSAPRQDPGGVAAAPVPEKPTAEPAPIVIAPLPPVVPEVPAPTPAPARARTPFEQRYSTLLANLDRTLSRGWGYEATYKEILEFSTAGAPKGTADHLKALAASLKNAVACRECAGGKVGCERCGGKGRVDLDCTVCQGQGRVRASGAVGDADVTVKCRNCDGKKIFRNVTCPACARAGKTVCAACKGKVWPDDRCPRPECNAGRMPCPTCNGKAFVMEKCPFCVNGRQKAPGAVNGADVTMKCRNCEIDGQHGTGQFKVECKTCSKTGKVTCNHCGGVYGNAKDGAAKGKAVETGTARPVSSAKVYALEKCADCSGAGCDICFGIGSRVRPTRIID